MVLRSVRPSTESVIVGGSLWTTGAMLRILCISSDPNDTRYGYGRWLKVTEFSTLGGRHNLKPVSHPKNHTFPALSTRLFSVPSMSDSKNTLTSILSKSNSSLELDESCSQLLDLTSIHFQNSSGSKQQTLTDIEIDDLLEQLGCTDLLAAIVRGTNQVRSTGKMST